MDIADYCEESKAESSSEHSDTQASSQKVTDIAQPMLCSFL